MALYSYKAIKATGDSVEGTYVANNKDQVLSMLRESKYYPVKIEEVVDRDIKNYSLFSRVKTKDIAFLCRQFYVMLNAGVSIINCLDILRQQTQNKKLKKSVSEMYEGLQKGLTLSEAMKNQNKIFPGLMINLTEAGEVSGNLDVIMDRLADHFEKENKINNKLRGAMIYPIILVVVAVAVVIFLLTTVLPMFIGMFESAGVTLPLPTRMLLYISNSLTIYWYGYIAVISLIVLLMKKLISSQRGGLIYDTLKLRLPIIKKVTVEVATARFTRTLATLISSGVPLLEALETVSRVVGNKLIAEGITEAKDDVKRGTNLSEPLGRLRVFSPMVISMINIGEESGTLDEILDKTADFYEEEVEASIQRMTTMFEPMMIGLMAVLIGFIVIAIALPMFDIINTIQI